MKLEDVNVVGGELNPITHDVVLDVEAALNITFPVGYREFITALGQGFFCESYVRVYPPRRILKEYQDVQKRWAEYWFWDESRNILPKEKALQAIIIADTMEGDELIFCPNEPEQLYILPRNKNTVFQVGSTLWEALEWLCRSGILIEPMQDNTFEPFEWEWSPEPSMIKLTRQDVVQLIEETRVILADFEGMGLNLKGCDLSDADLHGLDLQGACLESVSLDRANLQGAYLREANLVNASLVNANLQSADLKKARLDGANLIGATLKNAELTGASLKGTIIMQEQLRSTKRGSSVMPWFFVALLGLCPLACTVICIITLVKVAV